MPDFETSSKQSQSAPTSRFGFVLVIIFMVFEYGRPQDKIGFIGAMRPALVLMTLMAFSWFAAAKKNSLSTSQSWHMLFFFLLMALHVPFATNGFRAFQVAEGYLLLFPLCISIVLFVDSFHRLRTLINWWCVLALYIAVNGIVGGGMAGSAFLSDENDFSLLMNMLLPFALCLLFYEKKAGLRLFYFITSLACAVGVVASSSRGGFVGMIVVLGVIWLASPRKLLSMLLVVVLATSVLIFADQKYWDRMSTIENTDEGTAKERLDSWEAGWEMFKDNPLGVGPGNFPVRFHEYQPPSMKRSMWGRAAHSLFFTLLPELGVPGTLLYLSLLVVNLKGLRFLRRLPQQNDDHRFLFFLSLAFTASLAGYFASGMFLSVLYYPHYWYLTAMIVASGYIARASSSQSRMQ